MAMMSATLRTTDTRMVKAIIIYVHIYYTTREFAVNHINS